MQNEKKDIKAFQGLEAVLEAVLDRNYKMLCDRCKKLELWHKRLTDHLKACYQMISLLNSKEESATKDNADLKGVIERKALKKINSRSVKLLNIWCPGRDSNPHSFDRTST